VSESVSESETGGSWAQPDCVLKSCKFEE
jgi:hypothetical protein